MLATFLVPGSFKILSRIKFYLRWNDKNIINELNIFFQKTLDEYIAEIQKLYQKFIKILETNFANFFDGFNNNFDYNVESQEELEDLYKLFGISSNSSEEDIKKAYRRLAKQYHPDVNKSVNSEEIMKKINDGYEKLMFQKEHA
ncbi:DnaJ domain-containing protein [Spiroplasma eriocheiris]|uniref:J domain-containing protein n=1 Tax=Spiroplasma eriocheiris TaxID=315358 RepID=A0A0H3XJT3_9MOLU|nr:DnaJ domain-containing protein [Spiroplasma eriocheiris]AHF57685.1 putative chaperone protein [Spiroplasma eriocheiris CCTCC M 207170]AKM54136.1 hypothetical protein SERIO_v1c05650 [Spiroplasma eriocheiris]